MVVVTLATGHQRQVFISAEAVDVPLVQNAVDIFGSHVLAIVEVLCGALILVDFQGLADPAAEGIVFERNRNGTVHCLGHSS